MIRRRKIKLIRKIFKESLQPSKRKIRKLRMIWQGKF